MKKLTFFGLIIFLFITLQMLTACSTSSSGIEEEDIPPVVMPLNTKGVSQTLAE